MSTKDNAENSAQQSKLDDAIQKIIRRYGDGSIKPASEAKKMTPNSIPTGSISLDIAIGIGGIPRGRVTEIYGPAASGKTTLVLSTLVEAQRLGGKTVFIDMEHVLDLSYAARLGVNLDDLLLVKPKTGEQAFEIMEELVRSGEVDLIVLDSIAALVTREELESNLGVDIGDQISKLIDQAMRKLSEPIASTNACVIFTNQLRILQGVMFGNPEKTIGDVSLTNWASVRLDMRRIQSIRAGNDTIGSRTRVRVIKNRLALPFKVTEFDILFNKGISKEGDVLDLATEHEIITKNGSFYSYGETSIGQGRLMAAEFLRQNEEIANEIEEKIHQEINPALEKSEAK